MDELANTNLIYIPDSHLEGMASITLLFFIIYEYGLPILLVSKVLLH